MDGKKEKEDKEDDWDKVGMDKFRGEVWIEPEEGEFEKELSQFELEDNVVQEEAKTEMLNPTVAATDEEKMKDTSGEEKIRVDKVPQKEHYLGQRCLLMPMNYSESRFWIQDIIQYSDVERAMEKEQSELDVLREKEAVESKKEHRLSTLQRELETTYTAEEQDNFGRVLELVDVDAEYKVAGDVELLRKLRETSTQRLSDLTSAVKAISNRQAMLDKNFIFPWVNTVIDPASKRYVKCLPSGTQLPNEAAVKEWNSIPPECAAMPRCDTLVVREGFTYPFFLWHPTAIAALNYWPRALKRVRLIGPSRINTSVELLEGLFKSGAVSCLEITQSVFITPTAIKPLLVPGLLKHIKTLVLSMNSPKMFAWKYLLERATSVTHLVLTASQSILNQVMPIVFTMPALRALCIVMTTQKMRIIRCDPSKKHLRLLESFEMSVHPHLARARPGMDLVDVVRDMPEICNLPFLASIASLKRLTTLSLPFIPFTMKRSALTGKAWDKVAFKPEDFPLMPSIKNLSVSRTVLDATDALVFRFLSRFPALQSFSSTSHTAYGHNVGYLTVPSAIERFSVQKNGGSVFTNSRRRLVCQYADYSVIKDAAERYGMDTFRTYAREAPPNGEELPSLIVPFDEPTQHAWGARPEAYHTQPIIDKFCFDLSNLKLGSSNWIWSVPGKKPAFRFTPQATVYLALECRNLFLRSQAVGWFCRAADMRVQISTGIVYWEPGSTRIPITARRPFVDGQRVLMHEWSRIDDFAQEEFYTELDKSLELILRMCTSQSLRLPAAQNQQLTRFDSYGNNLDEQDRKELIYYYTKGVPANGDRSAFQNSMTPRHAIPEMVSFNVISYVRDLFAKEGNRVVLPDEKEQKGMIMAYRRPTILVPPKKEDMVREEVIMPLYQYGVKEYYKKKRGELLLATKYLIKGATSRKRIYQVEHKMREYKGVNKYVTMEIYLANNDPDPLFEKSTQVPSQGAFVMRDYTRVMNFMRRVRAIHAMQRYSHARKLIAYTIDKRGRGKILSIVDQAYFDVFDYSKVSHARTPNPLVPKEQSASNFASASPEFLAKSGTHTAAEIKANDDRAVDPVFTPEYERLAASYFREQCAILFRETGLHYVLPPSTHEASLLVHSVTGQVLLDNFDYCLTTSEASALKMVTSFETKDHLGEKVDTGACSPLHLRRLSCMVLSLRMPVFAYHVLKESPHEQWTRFAAEFLIWMRTRTSNLDYIKYSNRAQMNLLHEAVNRCVNMARLLCNPETMALETVASSAFKVQPATPDPAFKNEVTREYVDALRIKTHLVTQAQLDAVETVRAYLGVTKAATLPWDQFATRHGEGFEKVLLKCDTALVDCTTIRLQYERAGLEPPVLVQPPPLPPNVRYAMLVRRFKWLLEDRIRTKINEIKVSMVNVRGRMQQLRETLTSSMAASIVEARKALEAPDLASVQPRFDAPLLERNAFEQLVPSESDTQYFKNMEQEHANRLTKEAKRIEKQYNELTKVFEMTYATRAGSRMPYAGHMEAIRDRLVAISNQYSALGDRVKKESPQIPVAWSNSRLPPVPEPSDADLASLETYRETGNEIASLNRENAELRQNIGFIKTGVPARVRNHENDPSGQASATEWYGFYKSVDKVAEVWEKNFELRERIRGVVSHYAADETFPVIDPMPEKPNYNNMGMSPAQMAAMLERRKIFAAFASTRYDERNAKYTETCEIFQKEGRLFAKRIVNSMQLGSKECVETVERHILKLAKNAETRDEEGKSLARYLDVEWKREPFVHHPVHAYFRLMRKYQEHFVAYTQGASSLKSRQVEFLMAMEVFAKTANTRFPSGIRKIRELTKELEKEHTAYRAAYNKLVDIKRGHPEFQKPPEGLDIGDWNAVLDHLQRHVDIALNKHVEMENENRRELGLEKEEDFDKPCKTVNLFLGTSFLFKNELVFMANELAAIFGGPYRSFPKIPACWFVAVALTVPAHKLRSDSYAEAMIRFGETVRGPAFFVIRLLQERLEASEALRVAALAKGEEPKEKEGGNPNWTTAGTDWAGSRGAEVKGASEPWVPITAAERTAYKAAMTGLLLGSFSPREEAPRTQAPIAAMITQRVLAEFPVIARSVGIAPQEDERFRRVVAAVAGAGAIMPVPAPADAEALAKQEEDELWGGVDPAPAPAPAPVPVPAPAPAPADPDRIVMEEVDD